jgi:hypothetical protein
MRGEYAMTVRSDWKGRGVGFMAMMRLLKTRHARHGPIMVDAIDFAALI